MMTQMSQCWLFMLHLGRENIKNSSLFRLFMFFLHNSTATETTVEAQTATETTVESDDSDTADD